MAQLELYESKVFTDRDLPVQLSVNMQEEPGDIFRAHWHEHIELHYVVRGESDIYINQQRHHLREKDLLIANGNELHRGVCTRGPYLGYVIVFTLAELAPELTERGLLFHTVIRQDPEAERLISRIFLELEKQEEAYKTMCHALVQELLVHLCRHHVRDYLSRNERMRWTQTQERLSAVLEYIEYHFTEHITNQTLADIACLSTGRFQHVFCEQIGMSPLQYINDLRLKKAAQLLMMSDYGVAQIAEKVGFSDYNHFGRLFRRMYGCTPRDVKLRKVQLQA